MFTYLLKIGIRNLITLSRYKISLSWQGYYIDVLNFMLCKSIKIAGKQYLSLVEMTVADAGGRGLGGQDACPFGGPQTS